MEQKRGYFAYFFFSLSIISISHLNFNATVQMHNISFTYAIVLDHALTSEQDRHPCLSLVFSFANHTIIDGFHFTSKSIISKSCVFPRAIRTLIAHCDRESNSINELCKCAVCDRTRQRHHGKTLYAFVDLGNETF